MRGRVTFSLVLLLILPVISQAVDNGTASPAPAAPPLDILIYRDMFFGADDFFGENRDLAYADSVAPKEEEKKEEVIVQVTSSRSSDSEKSKPSSGDTAGTGGSGTTGGGEDDEGDGGDLPIDPVDVPEPPDVGGCPT